MRSRAASPIVETRWCWRTYYAPTGTGTGRCRPIPSRSGCSGCWPGPSRTRYGRCCATPGGCAQCCGSSTPRRCRRFANLHTATAVTVLAAAPTPTAAANLSEADLQKLLQQAGYHAPRELPGKLRAIFTAEQLHQPAAVEAAMGQVVSAIVRTMAATLTSIRELERALDQHFGRHPDAEILRSLPGLGVVLGARVLGEFGDDPTRFTDAASRRAYAGSAPITRASGKARVVLMRRARNRRLAAPAAGGPSWPPSTHPAPPTTSAAAPPETVTKPRCAGWPTSCSASCTTA
jgi:Transposase IS116/IS110/IS902 family